MPYILLLSIGGIKKGVKYFMFQMPVFGQASGIGYAYFVVVVVVVVVTVCAFGT